MNITKKEKNYVFIVEAEFGNVRLGLGIGFSCVNPIRCRRFCSIVACFCFDWLLVCVCDLGGPSGSVKCHRVLARLGSIQTFAIKRVVLTYVNTFRVLVAWFHCFANVVQCWHANVRHDAIVRRHTVFAKFARVRIAWIYVF